MGLSEYFDAFKALPDSTQSVLVGGACFVIWIFRDRIGANIPAILAFLFKKKAWGEAKKQVPKSKVAEVVIQTNNVFRRTKVVYEVSQEMVFCDKCKLEKELIEIIDGERKKGSMIVLVMANLTGVSGGASDAIKSAADNIIEKNNIPALFVFPSSPTGNMLALFQYIKERIRLEDKAHLQVKLDTRRAKIEKIKTDE